MRHFGETLTLFSMRNYARLLFHHFVRIEQVGSLLEPAVALLKEHTSVEGKIPSIKPLKTIVCNLNGESQYRYTGSVGNHSLVSREN